jgi:hypothetical protein
MKEWDIPQTQAMVQIAGFSKEEENWIWEVERKAFEVY